MALYYFYRIASPADLKDASHLILMTVVIVILVGDNLYIQS